MVDSYSSTWNDYDNEKSTSGFGVAELTALNFDAQGTLQATYTAAAAAIVLGVHRQARVTAKGTRNLGIPTDQNAQRERKWLVTMLDPTADDFYKFELPTADFSFLQNNGSYLVQNGNIVGNDTGGEITAFVNALEAYYVSKAGNASTVWSIEAVGRNT